MCSTAWYKATILMIVTGLMWDVFDGVVQSDDTADCLVNLTKCITLYLWILFICNVNFTSYHKQNNFFKRNCNSSFLLLCSMLSPVRMCIVFVLIYTLCSCVSTASNINSLPFHAVSDIYYLHSHIQYNNRALKYYVTLC